MAMPTKKTPGSVDDFIGGAAATKADTATAKKKAPAPESKYLLAIDKRLRDQLKIEAIGLGVNMSEYICVILRRRKELDRKG